MNKKECGSIFVHNIESLIISTLKNCDSGRPKCEGFVFLSPKWTVRHLVTTSQNCRATQPVFGSVLASKAERGRKGPNPGS
jgi:hypothetical protein